jgi:uncharacterized protein YkwD
MQKERSMKRLLYLGLGLAALVAVMACTSSAAPAAEKAEYYRRYRPSQAAVLYGLLNQERQKAGLPALQFNNALWTAAYGHATNMARQNMLNHTLDGKGTADRITAAGYRYSYYGENIAYNYANAQATLNAWMNSPGHRANILSPNFTEMGISMAFNAQGQPYYCADFGRPQ